MSQDDIVPISGKDRQLLARHGLGFPLKMYRLKKRELRQFQILGWIACPLSLLMLFLLISLRSSDWQQVLVLTSKYPQDMWNIELRYYEPFFTMWSLFLIGLFSLLVMLPSHKRRRVIVCENGLLQIRGIVREKGEAIHWEEIQSFRKYADKLCLFRREGKLFMIRDTYEGFDALIAQIESSYTAI